MPTALFMTDSIRTPRPWCVVRSLPPGWGVVYRHFGSPDRYRVGLRIIASARRRKIVVLIAADPALARRIGADGVHWPERLLPSRTRSPGPNRPGPNWPGPDWIVTAAAHDARAIRRAFASGAHAAVVSPVFATAYQGTAEPLGLRQFRSMVRNAPLRCYGLGGITASTAARIAVEAGIASVGGVMSAFAPMSGHT